MTASTVRRVATLACVPICASGVASADVLYGITGGTHFVTIDSALPASATSVAITGLQPGEGIRGLDTHPRDGEITRSPISSASIASTSRILQPRRPSSR